MTEIKGDYLVTDEADAIRLLNINAIKKWLNERKYCRAQVRNALKPVVGEAYFALLEERNTKPDYYLEYYAGLESDIEEEVLRVAVNALSKGKTCGEIRELIEWAEGE